MTGLVDLHGQPLRREVLTREVAGPTLAGVRSPYGGYPGDALTPVRLANILREADQGDPMRYFELAEQIEERDLHYAGVLGTRKRSVAQLDITVEAASDDAHDVAIADMVRDWLTRDELADELFDMLDAIGKGLSFTEIIWDTSEGQWRPDRLEWRDPRFFTFAQSDGRTPLLRGGIGGNEPDAPLDPFKFIHLAIKAKSGLPVRSGVARIAAWAWMFKAFTQRDWAIFAQTFGQPVRVGKFHPGATKEDKATLFRAVANIAGDCAAIIPEGMVIEFIESANVGAGSDLYERRADWLDRQISKAILGQTNTTDAQAGGLGSGQAQVHKSVADDIEKADAKAAASALNRYLIRPWVDLEYGRQPRYPKVKIERAEPEDLERLARVLKDVVPLGVRIEEAQVRDKLGFAEPAKDARVLMVSSITNVPPAGMTVPALPAPPQRLALQGSQAPAASAPFPGDAIGDRLVDETSGDMVELLGTIETMIEKAGSLDELKEMLLSAFPDLDMSAMAAVLAQGLLAAHGAGRSDLEAESA